MDFTAKRDWPKTVEPATGSFTFPGERQNAGQPAESAYGPGFTVKPWGEGMVGETPSLFAKLQAPGQ